MASRHPHIPVGLSTASVYPEGAAAAFEMAADLGYDGVEVMVWTEPVSQEAGALRGLAELHEVEICSIHAPTLLLTQRVWGTEPWDKVDRSIELAEEVNPFIAPAPPPGTHPEEFLAAIKAEAEKLGAVTVPGGEDQVALRAGAGGRLCGVGRGGDGGAGGARPPVGRRAVPGIRGGRRRCAGGRSGPRWRVP